MLLNFSLYNRSHREHTANKATNTGANDNSQQCWELNFLLPPPCALRKMPHYLPERKKRFPSWAGAEKIRSDLNFGEKTAFLLRLVQDPAAR